MITVLGSSGFVGSHIVGKLRMLNQPYFAPARDEELTNRELGDVIYCIGLTADFREKPFDTVEAHVCKLNFILKNCDFSSLTYLSSTRVYINCKGEVVNENDPISINIHDPEELYTLTKLTGERIGLSSGRNVRIARLSNVIGDDRLSANFITNVIGQIKSEKSVRFFTTPDSEKDYIPVDIAADLLIHIASSGKNKIYNVASGLNLSNQLLIELLKEQFEFSYTFDDNAREIKFPRIDVSNLTAEFGYMPSVHIDKLKKIIKNYAHDTN